MNIEGSIPLMNESGGFFGAELATHERIRSVQSQIRIAIQNHHLLYSRAQAFPKDADLENHMKILQDLILSLGRTQLELMYQFKIEMKEKHGVSNLNNVMGMYLGWPDRHEMHLYKPKENGASTDGDRRAHIMKKKPILPQVGRPKVKMQSLLKVNHNRSILTPRKESERVRGSTKLSDSPNSVINSAKKLQSVLKARNEKISQAMELAKESGDADLKDSLSSGSSKIEESATSIENVTQESFLGFFGLIHKDKSKNMVATQTKRKRRSAAGQSNFHGDFSYFQAKRAYTKRAAASSSVPESPTSSQDVVDADENDRLSLTSTDKPSGPTSPEIPSSQDMTDVATSQELSADVCTESAKENSSAKIDGSVEPSSADAGQAKIAGEGNSDRINEKITLDSNKIKGLRDTETTVRMLNKGSTSQVIEREAGLTNPNQFEEQEYKEELTAVQSINQDIHGSELNMETSEAEILLRYSPETDSVELVQVKPTDTLGIGHKPTSLEKPETLNESVSSVTRTFYNEEVTHGELATGTPDSLDKLAATGKQASPEKSASPPKSASPQKPVSPGHPETPSEPLSPANPEKPESPELPATPGEPASPERPETPGDREHPATLGEPESPEHPATLGDPASPEHPVTLGEPAPSEHPATPVKLTSPELPATPGEPASPEHPETPGDPASPEHPATLGEPASPEHPETPRDPASPEHPATLGEPASPEHPATPGDPASPEHPATLGDPASPEHPVTFGEPAPSEHPATPVKLASPELPATLGELGSPEHLPTPGDPASPEDSATPGEPASPATPDKPESPCSEDQSDDSDPTSFMPNNESQNLKSSRSYRSSDLCSVCFQSSDAEMEKCSMCGEDFHRECAPNAACPICQSTSSTISSIVGVNTTSRLTSTDCSEVIKRYLDDTQEENKPSADDRDYNRPEVAPVNYDRGVYSEPTNNYRDHMELYDSADGCGIADSNELDSINVDDDDSFDGQDDCDSNDAAESEDIAESRRGAIDITGNAELEEMGDSNDGQVGADSNDSAEYEDCENEDGSLSARDILLQDDDSLVFPNSSVFEDNSCSNSQL